MKQKIAEISFLHVFITLLGSTRGFFFLAQEYDSRSLYQFHVPLFFFMRFLDKRKTSFLVFLFTLAVSIIALHVNKGPLMDLFFAMGGILMSVALARLYAKYELHFFNHLSPASYTIYLYHGIFQALSLQILMRFTHFDIGFYIILAFLTGVLWVFLGL